MVAYIVKRGDTLRGIAAQFEVDANELRRYNGLSLEEADALPVGKRLFIPPKRGETPAAERTTSRPAPARATATRQPSSEPVAYTVRAGDTLRGIAERFDVSVERLVEYNGLSPAEADSLRPGQRLFIPRR